MEEIEERLASLNIKDDKLKKQFGSAMEKMKKCYRKELETKRCTIFLKDYNPHAKLTDEEKKITKIELKVEKVEEKKEQLYCQAIKKKDGQVCGAKLKEGQIEFCGRHCKKT